MHVHVSARRIIERGRCAPTVYIYLYIHAYFYPKFPGSRLVLARGLINFRRIDSALSVASPPLSLLRFPSLSPIAKRKTDAEEKSARDRERERREHPVVYFMRFLPFFCFCLARFALYARARTRVVVLLCFAHACVLLSFVPGRALFCGSFLYLYIYALRRFSVRRAFYF